MKEFKEFKEPKEEIRQEETALSEFPSKKPYEIQMENMRQGCQVALQRVSLEDMHGNNMGLVDPLEMNNSQASSCDYNMSQFRTDEPDFVIKEEAAPSENDEDAEDIPLAARKIIKRPDFEEEVPLVSSQ